MEFWVTCSTGSRRGRRHSNVSAVRVAPAATRRLCASKQWWRGGGVAGEGHCTAAAAAAAGGECIAFSAAIMGCLPT